MARSAFPAGDFGRRVSDSPIGADIGAPAAGAAQGVAEAARGFGRELGRMADRAWTREGERDAARAITAADQFGQEVQLRPGFGVDDEAFNAVAREHLLTRRIGSYQEELSKAEIANPDSVEGFASARAAVRQAYRDKATGDPRLDAAFEREATVQDQAALRRVRQGQERTRISTARGAWTDAAATGETLLGQAIVSAGFDDAGAQLVGVGLNNFASRLAQFGPREAFTIGGIAFAADPSRAGVVSPEELAQQFDQVQTRTRMSWIMSAAERSPDVASRRAFIGQVRERWAAGDPAFVGLAATQMDQLVNRMEAGLAREEADQAAAVRAAGEQARDLLKAYEYGGAVDTDQMLGLARQSGDPGLIAEAEYRLAYGFEVSPRDKTAGAVGGGFQGTANVLLDRLEGEGFVANDGGRGRSQWGVTEKSHPEAWRDGQVSRAEAVQVAREYWDAIDGDNLSPDLAMAALAAAYVGGIETSKGFLSQANGDVNRFLALEEARFRRLAGGDQEKLNGWLARQGKVRAAISQQTAQRRAQEGYASDPIGFARGNRNRPPMATVTEFDPNSLFDGRGAEWADALRSRRATGQELARRDGVPARMLSSEEVTFYKAEFEARPEAVVQFATTAAQTLGGAGARDLLGELSRGGVAGADLHLAWLATENSTRGVAAKVVQGRALRAGGAKDVVFDRDDASIAETAQRFAPALAMQPELFAVVQSTARDMAIADAARGQLQSAEAYVNSALGATRSGGHTYGGVARVNGADTLAPTWLRNDYLDDALEMAADLWAANDQGPVYSNGQPIPARVLRGYRLKATPRGTYRLVNTAGEEIPARSGRAFEFNIEADSFRDRLRRRLPGAVLPEGGR